MKKVAIIMGSDSDWKVMEKAAKEKPERRAMECREKELDLGMGL